MIALDDLYLILTYSGLIALGVGLQKPLDQARDRHAVKGLILWVALPSAIFIAVANAELNRETLALPLICLAAHRLGFGATRGINRLFDVAPH
ncbi:MAG: hypothetical protein ACFCBW_15010 [Candidatus Competibacterales bacterium]